MIEDAATFEACSGQIVRLSSSHRHPILQLCPNLKALIVDFVTCVSECFAFVHHGSAPRMGQERETGGEKSKTLGDKCKKTRGDTGTTSRVWRPPETTF